MWQWGQIWEPTETSLIAPFARFLRRGMTPIARRETCRPGDRTDRFLTDEGALVVLKNMKNGVFRHTFFAEIRNFDTGPAFRAEAGSPCQRLFNVQNMPIGTNAPYRHGRTSFAKARKAFFPINVAEMCISGADLLGRKCLPFSVLTRVVKN